MHAIIDLSFKLGGGFIPCTDPSLSCWCVIGTTTFLFLHIYFSFIGAYIWLQSFLGTLFDTRHGSFICWSATFLNPFQINCFHGSWICIGRQGEYHILLLLFLSFFFFACYQVELHGLYDVHGKITARATLQAGVWALGLYLFEERGYHTSNFFHLLQI